MIPTTPSSHKDDGFTLAEICVAMMLVAIVATGVAGLCTLAIAVCDAARVQTSAVILAGQKIEQLRALTWTIDASGAAVSDGTSDLSRDPAATGGAGLGTSPADSLDANVAGYVDFLNASGEWVGTGASAPPLARYIRRWRVKPLAGDSDALVLQVLVTTPRQDRLAPRPRRRLPGDALVTTVLVRKAP
jgi:prepilin-type N-terminal cleavage/methylation domain-containing protein